jgi:hypothetical protein
VVVLDPVLTRRDNSIGSKCRHCAAKALLWCAAKAQPETYGPKLKEALAEKAPTDGGDVPEAKRQKVLPEAGSKAVQKEGKQTPPPKAQVKTPASGKRFANLAGPVEPLGVDELLELEQPPEPEPCAGASAQEAEDDAMMNEMLWGE